jgi:hypothetical protein
MSIKAVYPSIPVFVYTIHHIHDIDRIGLVIAGHIAPHVAITIPELPIQSIVQ